MPTLSIKRGKKMNNKFPFDFNFVLELDIPNYKIYRNADRAEIQTDCPFCEKGKKKLYINKYKGTYYCQHCKDSGGMLKFHMKMNNLNSTKEAMKDLMQKLNGLSAEDRKAMQSISHQDIKAGRVASIERRDACYKRLIENCSLSVKDRNNLHERGLTDEAIKQFGIVSTPVLTKTIAENMLIDSGISPKDRDVYLNHYINDFKQNGSDIPGIYLHKGAIRLVKLKEGILIPVINKAGMISMFQVRYRDLQKPLDSASEEEITEYKSLKDSFHKYAQLSSGFIKGGCSTSGLEKVHHVGFNFDSIKTPNEVCLTEGCLKADVASYLEGNKPYMAILGVNNTNELSEEFAWLRQKGTKRIRVRFDMDFVENDAVALAIYEANEIAQKQGYISVLIKPHNPSKVLKDEYETIVQILNGKVRKQKNSLRYTVLDEIDQLKNLDKVIINDLWNGEIGKGIDDYLKNAR